MKLFKAISAPTSIALIALVRKDGDLVSLRRRLDSFLEKYGNDYPFMVAFDGALLFAEERGEEGEKRFSECIETLSGDECADAQYVRLFCRFHLNLGNRQIQDSAREQAKRLEVDSWIHWFLNFLPKESMENIERQRRAQIGIGKDERNNAMVSFDF